MMGMMSLATSGWLQNVFKYCTKVLKTGLAWKESNNSATVCTRSPLMTQGMSAEIYKLSGGAFRLDPPIGVLLVEISAEGEE